MFYMKYIYIKRQISKKSVGKLLTSKEEFSNNQQAYEMVCNIISDGETKLKPMGFKYTLTKMTKIKMTGTTYN